MLEQLADWAAEQMAEGVDGSHIQARCRLFVQGCDGAAVQASEA
jgi:hypothetical protein